MPKNTTPTTMLGGAPVKLYGDFPLAGKAAPAFLLVNKDLQNITLDSFVAKRKVLDSVLAGLTADGIESPLIVRRMGGVQQLRGL